MFRPFLARQENWHVQKDTVSISKKTYLHSHGRIIHNANFLNSLQKVIVKENFFDWEQKNHSYVSESWEAGILYCRAENCSH